MYSELFRRRIYRPAICLGVTICAVAALMDPLSRSYVAYQTLTRSGFNFGSAVLMSMLSLYGAYSVGALLALLLCPRLCAAGRIRTCSAQLGGLQNQLGSAAFAWTSRGICVMCLVLHCKSVPGHCCVCGVKHGRQQTDTSGARHACVWRLCVACRCAAGGRPGGQGRPCAAAQGQRGCCCDRCVCAGGHGHHVRTRAAQSRDGQRPARASPLAAVAAGNAVHTGGKACLVLRLLQAPVFRLCCRDSSPTAGHAYG